MKTEITSNSLQELINKRAESKAKSEIQVLVNALSSSGILQINECYTTENGKERDISYSLSDTSFNQKDNILTKLYNKKVAAYIISETKEFVSKVESLVEQADNLLNISENYNY